MMATYFHGGSEIQAASGGGDNLQTLYLMNPNYIAAYSNESPHNHHHHNNQTSPNMLLLNHPSAGGAPPTALAQGSIAHASHPAQQQLIGIPFAGPHFENNPSRPSSSSSLQGHDPSHHHQISSSLHGLAVSRVHYNLWSPTVDPSPTHTQPGPIQTVTVAGHADVDGFRRPPTGGTGAQGLSLSLSPHHHQHQNSGAVIGAGGDDGRMSVTVSNGVQGVILGSKYLKAAQELLDEVVNVSNYRDLNNTNDKSGGPHKNKAKAATSPVGERLSGGGGGGGEGSSSGSKRPAEQLTTAQRQELQMKKAKLLNMLDEVDQRYRQYHSQMQVVVSSFENASGIGSAKSYTSLALQTISKQFRCLKDGITSQIKATNKSLGEEDSNGGPGVKLEGGAGSRLRFVDHQLRQQRALQQLGMMQHNAWRSQRGLPERAVSVLRAWLFEHFLHPYPKDSDKHMLAKQTGLTRSQVSNWFINARVRLWKPMVEEMYTEEMKAQEQNGSTSEDNNNTITPNNNSTYPSNDQDNDQSISKTTATTIVPQQHEHHSTTIIQPHHHHHQHPDHTTTNDMISNMSTTPSQGFTLIGSSSDMESLMARSPKKQRSGSDIQNSPSSILSMDMEMKPPDNTTGFNPYIVHDMGRFNPDQLAGHPYHGNNGVSLTLGLPHCDNLSLSGNHHQQNFIPSQGIRLEIGAHGEAADFCGISVGQPSHPANGYESIDLQSRKRFAAQLLHDFVA